MTIGVLKEPGFETRVSLIAETIGPLIKKGIQVLVEPDAGKSSWCSNTDYEKVGAKITSANEIISQSDILLRIHPPEAAQLSGGKAKIFIGVFQPLYNTDIVKQFKSNNNTVFSLDMLPRTTRAQSMDVLSSQANIAGYKAVVLAADSYPRYFPMFMTAAGSIAPAKALILGAGVAGLQAIATARRLGAVVEVFDTRPAVKEEVMSLGGKFIEVEGAADASKAGGYAVEQTAEYQQKQQKRIGEAIAKADIVITTAQIPGKKAPILITNAMLDTMRQGSVVIDLAAATGGNTEVTKNNESVQYKGVTIIGNSSLQSSMPYDASKLYGKNVVNFVQLLIDKDGKLNLNWDDDLVKGSCITHNGEVMHERVKALVSDRPGMIDII
jgi:NAD(P) transhydrogenase subunit alpha